MATTTLKPIRQQTDVTLRATLTDNGVKASWPDFSTVKAFIYAERQRIIAGECTVEVDLEDDTVLVCRYDATKPQHLGIQKLVILVEYDGQKNTYDKQAFQFVATTDETLDDGTTVEEEVAEVDIDVTDIDTSALSGAIAAALAAAEAANEAANVALAAAGSEPYIGDNGNWFIWDPELQQYVDSGKPSQGDPGFTLEETTDPTDPEYQDEYQRVLAVLYQAINDVREALSEMFNALRASTAATAAAAEASSAANQKAGEAGAASDDAEAAATLANQKAAVARDAAEAAAAAASRAQAAADAVIGAAEAAAAAAAAAQDAAAAAAEKAALADEKASDAAEQGAYAKEQGDYAKEQIEGAKGAFESLDARFNNTEEHAVTLDETTDPTDSEYQDEYQRILAVLYQAIDDVIAAEQLAKDATVDARAGAEAAAAAAARAVVAATNAMTQAGAAEAAALAAQIATDQAKGSFPSLNARLEAIESGKQDKILDLDEIREGAGKGETAYQKPEAGIPLLHLALGVQESLGKADTAIQFVENNDPSSLIDNQ